MGIHGVKSPDFAPGLPKKDEHGDLSQLKSGDLVDFVVQRHAAARAGPHYDVRIGRPDTGLFSWATRKEFPKPGGKIALFQQPLHRHEYKDFEGEIPAGEYGAGTVKKHEEGRVLITKISDKAIQFTKAHKKNPERFALVRPKVEKMPWILINTTPTEPVPYQKTHYTKVPPSDANKVFDGLQPGSSVQAKVDGAAALTKILDDKLEVVSYRTAKETGHPITHTERIFKGGPTITISVPKQYIGSILRQELYGTRKGKVIRPQELGGILNATVAHSMEAQKERGIELKNMLFDVQQIGKKSTKEMPYSERMTALKEIAKLLPKERFHVAEEATTPEAAKKLFELIRSGKHPLTREGVVVHPSKGKPSKIKFVEDHDVHITGIFPGEGRLKGKGAGGFTYALKEGGPAVGKVGTGFDEALRRDMHKNPDDYIGRVAKIRAQEQHPSGAFRAPTLIALHEDWVPVKTKTSAISDEMRAAFIREMEKMARVTLEASSLVSAGLASVGPGVAIYQKEKSAAFKLNIGKPIRTAASWVGNTMKAGWTAGTTGPSQAAHAFDRDVSKILPVGWFGQGQVLSREPGIKHRLGNAFERVTTLGGVTRYLPVGQKTMVTAGALGGLNEARKKEDPKGLGRSRAERLARAGAMTAVGVGSMGVKGTAGLATSMFAPQAVGSLFDKAERAKANKRGMMPNTGGAPAALPAVERGA